ncbi:hypothetical protein NKT34_08815 [Paenibacillus polysaccharolyticus]|uniref:hypothetical protein n=1 Tax=Paenibacillus polysaccharolyticus TaxID=582692 RepID=UPI00209C8ADA|nr:hypothetical protein [Paenibacillus polysaccharolyticus]MCP1133390.1 hypothetical protein [Paenibacillus polysaccharolyticus]
MNKKTVGILFFATALGVVGTASIIPNSTLVSADSVQVNSSEELPSSLKYDSEHPDKIYVDNGVFIKVDQAGDINLNDKEVVQDVFDVTDQTNVILAYDATYVRTQE